MSTKVPVDEAPRNFREVAKYLRLAAEQIETIADTLEKDGLEMVTANDKAKALKAVDAITNWVKTAYGSYPQAKLERGDFGIDTRGEGPQTGSKKPGAGNKKKKAKE